MEKIIRVREKRPYGNVLFEPRCDLSKLFCALLDQLTLSTMNIKVIRIMGYKIECEGEKKS